MQCQSLLLCFSFPMPNCKELSLLFTYLQNHYGGGRSLAIWVYDGNVPFLQIHRIALFLMVMAVTLFYFHSLAQLLLCCCMLKLVFTSHKRSWNYGSLPASNFALLLHYLSSFGDKNLGAVYTVTYIHPRYVYTQAH